MRFASTWVASRASRAPDIPRARQRLRRKRIDALIGPARQHIGLRVGEMATRDAARPVDVTLRDGLGQLDMRAEHRAALRQRRVGAARRALVGPLLFVTGPQRLEAADDRDDGVISAAADNEIVELATDFSEEPAVVEMLGHRIVDLP